MNQAAGRGLRYAPPVSRFGVIHHQKNTKKPSVLEGRKKSRRYDVRNFFLALATATLIFTVSLAFGASSPSLKDVGMFADEYVGKTFTFDVYITTDPI